MKEVYRDLYVGSDLDVQMPLVRVDWAVVSACKDGPWGHRYMLGYKTPSAPKDDHYLVVQKSEHLGLNLIDSTNPDFISGEAINAGVVFIAKCLAEGYKVLVHCNEGRSRGPTVAMLYLYQTGLIPPGPLTDVIYVFKQLYEAYDPGVGMLEYLKRRFTQ